MGKVWTDAEKDLLRKYKAHMSNPELAAMIGCTEYQVIYAMRKFNIKRTDAELTALWEKWDRMNNRSYSSSPNYWEHRSSEEYRYRY